MNSIFTFLLFGGLITGLVCVCTGIFLLYKHYGDDRVTVKIRAFGEIHTRQSGLVLVFFGLFLFAFSGSSYEKARRVEQLQSQLSTFMVTTAKDLRREFHDIIDNQQPPIALETFKHVTFLISVLQQIDPDNGYAFYYTGEVKLWEGKPLIEARQTFYRYLEVSSALPESEKGGDVEVSICYERPRGYCRQRSGWIHNLLANDFYSEASAASDSPSKILLFEKAREQIELSLKDYPEGFLQREYPRTLTHIVATKVLQQDVANQIKTLKPQN